VPNTDRNKLDHTPAEDREERRTEEEEEKMAAFR
jgi:hypothetical protein